MPTVYHFDIPVNNANRAQQFYKDVFGWNMKKLNSQVDPKVDLWMCETEDENGRKGITRGIEYLLTTKGRELAVSTVDLF
jgi:predicted enzyme related to lactoylglutathione lyase